jgi:predicted nucleotidyltransferase
MTIKDIEERGMIAYKYTAGSHSQNLAGPDSDVDYHGVYFADFEKLIGLGNDYQEEVSDEKHDETYHEFGKWMTLLSKGNPNALESLFIPENLVIGEVHPVIKEVLEYRDKFLSKEVVKSLSGYAFNQIKKARGLGKKIVNPVTERKDVLDFCYTFKNQGSQPIKEFLAENGLDQRYCGVVNIPNMKDTYGVYYDWAAYFKFENIDWYRVDFGTEGVNRPFNKFISFDDAMMIQDRIKNKEFFKYSGIVYPEDIEKSNEIRLSSIPKGERPICFMTYNKDAYTCHCREYKEYQEWVEKRNQKRYSKAVEAGYNQKNMCHCVRLLTMAKEVSEGKGFNLWRTDDRDFLMGIKNGDYTYEYLIDYAEKLLTDVEKSLPNSDLPDEVDKDFVNKLLIKGRKEYYGIK